MVYMAPELFQVEDQSSNPLAKPPADIYALGMLIYEVFPRVVYSTMVKTHTLTGALWGVPVSRPRPQGTRVYHRPWRQTQTAFVVADSGPRLGYGGAVLERGASGETEAGRNPLLFGFR